jgi:hypothetical protein
MESFRETHLNTWGIDTSNEALKNLLAESRSKSSSQIFALLNLAMAQIFDIVRTPSAPTRRC